MTSSSSAVIACTRTRSTATSLETTYHWPGYNWSGVYEQLFPLVRQINQRLPLQKRLRVVAADPPIDWSKVENQAEYISIRNDRGSSITSVIMTEVLAKKRKALLLFGQ